MYCNCCCKTAVVGHNYSTAVALLLAFVIVLKYIYLFADLSRHRGMPSICTFSVRVAVGVYLVARSNLSVALEQRLGCRTFESKHTHVIPGRVRELSSRFAPRPYRGCYRSR